MPPIKIHHTEISEGAWDGPGNVARLRTGESAGYYHKMFAWQDPEADEETKGAYKFPHHEVSGDGDPGAANVKGCQSGIGVLNGAMGGADIPEGDRQGVYRHLVAHLEDADVEPADLRGSGPQGGREERAFKVSELRVAEEDGHPARIVGHAAVFDQLSDDLGGFREQIKPGAFSKTLQKADIRALWQHDVNYVLGRRKNNTLRVWEDAEGLAFEILPPNTQWASDVLVTLQRGDVDQMSFGFRTIRDRWEQDEEDNVTRTLIEVELFDISPVTFPAYPQTSAEARSRAQELHQQSIAAPGQEPHPAADDSEQVRARLDQMRRLLDLAEQL